MNRVRGGGRCCACGRMHRSARAWPASHTAHSPRLIPPRLISHVKGLTPDLANKRGGGTCTTNAVRERRVVSGRGDGGGDGGGEGDGKQAKEAATAAATVVATVVAREAAMEAATVVRWSGGERRWRRCGDGGGGGAGDGGGTVVDGGGDGRGDGGGDKGGCDGDGGGDTTATMAMAAVAAVAA
eukprot:7384554-Prymnesium_polylepis.2